MKTQWGTMLAVAVAAAGILGPRTLRAVGPNVVTLTVLSTGLTNPIGIDWLPSTNQMLVSTNWASGWPNNFEVIDRITGVHTPWGSTAGWTDEIYFAAVRQEQTGWTQGKVYSANTD